MVHPNAGQIILQQQDKIVQNWIKAVNQDGEIPSSSKLTHQAIKDSMPKVINSLGEMLASDEPNDLSSVKSFEHGIHRAHQEYDVEEMIREYVILRQILYSQLESILLQLPPAQILNTIKSINEIVDQIISISIKNYVKTKLDQLHQLYNQIILTNTELMRLVEIHQDNLSYLGHELKNPLASIIGYSDLLLRLKKQKKLENPSQEDVQYIEKVFDKGKELLRIINDSLDLSVSHQNNLKLNIESIEVCDSIKNIVEMLQPAAKAKQLELKYACYLTDLNITTDSLRLQQIVTNLITNAIRYTDSGSIEVTCQPSGGDWSSNLNSEADSKATAHRQIEIAVCDTGRGISAEDLAKVFQPYFRVANRFKYHPDSRGLGLAIVAQFVKRLQGEIKVSSQLDKGSTFTIILPQTFQE